MRYSARQLEHFHHAEHAGTLDTDNSNVIVVKEGSIEREKIIHVYLSINNETIMSAKFLSYASVAVIACCEYACRWLEGKSMTEAQLLTAKNIMEGLEMPSVQLHVAMLVERCIKTGLSHFMR